MFQSVIVALGSVALITMEDAGSFYYEDERGKLAQPDFRIVRRDGQQLLVEVKNVGPRKSGEVGVRRSDLVSLQQYAELTHARLVYAHYWSGFNLWTLVDSSIFEPREGKMILEFSRAMSANEMSLVGDRSIGTRPPLTVSLVADASKPRDSQSIDDSTHQVSMVIGDVSISCEGRTLTSQTERDLAWFLAMYGTWPGEEVVHIDEDGRLDSMEMIFAPVEDDGTQRRFELVGWLSSMHSMRYNVSTLTDSGRVRTLNSEAEPGSLAAMIPADYWDDSRRDLPIWQVEVRPSIGPEAAAATTDGAQGRPADSLAHQADEDI
ncbi:MAG TPA: hypothetical protein VIP77_16660 [Jiangellaceae bacterium]